MAKLNVNSSFQSWHLTEQELLQGCVLSTVQKQAIQNLVVEYAEEKISLPWVKANKQREAELQGSISVLKYLLERSDAAEKQLITQVPDVENYTLQA